VKTRILGGLRLAGVLAALVFGAAVRARAADGEIKLEAQLVVGMNDAKPKDSTLKPVSHEVEKKLKRLPLKWDHYYVAGEKKFKVPEGKSRSESLGPQCEITVKNLADSKVVMTLMSQGQTVGRVTQTLRDGQTLVAGGSAENTIVVLTQSK
jgi:hypothetical protein